MAGRFTVETVFKGVDRISGTITKIQAKSVGMTRSLSKGLGDVSAKMSKVSEGLSKVGAVGLAAGTAVAGGMFAATRTGAEFEQVMANVTAAARPTMQELDELARTAMSTGADFGFSATSVASAMEAMSKQGLSVQQVIAGIGGVASAAAADGASLEDTMGGLLSTMAGMGLGADKMQHIADVMAMGADSTAASIGSLSESMSVFGPTAKAMGIPIEAAIGQLALLQDAGLDASSAGTTLSAVYSKLASPTKSTADQMRKMGLSVRDSFGNMKSPAQLMTEIFQASQKIKGNVGQAAAFTELVGLNSQKALLLLADSVGSGKFERVMKGVTEGVDGYAASVAKIKQNSTIGDVKKLSAALEVMQIQIFGLVSGELRGLVAGTTKWIAANKDLIAQRVGDFIRGVKEHLPEIVTWFKRIGIGLAVFYAVKTAVGVAQVAIAAYELAVMAASGATTVFSAVTNRETITMVASKVATGLATVAKGAYSAAVGIGTVATTGFTLAEARAKIALIASNVVTWLATTARAAFATASGAAAAGSTAMGVAAAGSAAGIATASLALAPFLGTVLAVTAAIGALTLAWSQWKELEAQTGGLGVGGTIGKMIEMGTFDPFAAIDAHMNEQAIALNPRPSHVNTTTSHTERSEVILKTAPGVTASQSRGKKSPGLKLAPTGAF